MEQRAKHNALLKQLLSKEQAFRGEAHPPSTPDVSHSQTTHHQNQPLTIQSPLTTQSGVRGSLLTKVLL